MFSHNSTYFLCNKYYDNTYLLQFFNLHFYGDCSMVIEVGFSFAWAALEPGAFAVMLFVCCT
jgi:hypothetical protein